MTAAPLPAGYTHFNLQRRPLQVDGAVRHRTEGLITPVGTTYTFTVTTDEAASNLISFELRAGRPLPVHRPGIKPVLGDVVVTTEFLVPILRYNTLDSTGAAATVGSYAFLTTTGDASTAIGNFGYSVDASVELRIHPSDASGTSRAAFYDTVRVGDRFDYQTNGILCAFRFTVTSVPETASPRTFGIERVNRYGGWCGEFVDESGCRQGCELRLGAPFGHPG